MAISKKENSRPAITAAFGVFKPALVRVSFAMIINPAVLPPLSHHAGSRRLSRFISS